MNDTDSQMWDTPHNNPPALPPASLNGPKSQVCLTCGQRPIGPGRRFRCEECISRAQQAVDAWKPGDGPILQGT